MESEYTPEQKREFRETFKAIDADRNGYLDPGEMSRFMTMCHLETRYIKALFKVFDKNADGRLSFDEFLDYLDSCKKTERDPHYLFKKIFDALDEDSSNELTAPEMVEYADLCSIEMSREQAEAEIRRLDKDHNGALTFEELCEAFGI